MGAQSSSQRDGKSQEDAPLSASASGGELSAEVKTLQDSKPLEKNGQISSLTSLNGHSEDNTLAEGLKSALNYILYSILVLLLLILLMVTGIKFSQLNKDITDVKLQLGTMKHRGSTSSSAKEESAAVTNVFLDELVPVRGTCKEGWVSFQRSCYLMSTTEDHWNKAEEQCRSHSGHLLVLNSVEELDYISRVVELNHNYWIGLVERQQEGHWSWVDGTDFNSTPKFWDKGQPDDWDYRVDGEDCGQLHSTVRRKRKLWNDADCSLPYRYICETKA